MHQSDSQLLLFSHLDVILGPDSGVKCLFSSAALSILWSFFWLWTQSLPLNSYMLSVFFLFWIWMTSLDFSTSTWVSYWIITSPRLLPLFFRTGPVYFCSSYIPFCGILGVRTSRQILCLPLFSSLSPACSSSSPCRTSPQFCIPTVVIIPLFCLVSLL